MLAGIRCTFPTTTSCGVSNVIRHYRQLRNSAAVPGHFLPHPYGSVCAALSAQGLELQAETQQRHETCLLQFLIFAPGKCHFLCEQTCLGVLRLSSGVATARYDLQTRKDNFSGHQRPTLAFLNGSAPF